MAYGPELPEGVKGVTQEMMEKGRILGPEQAVEAIRKAMGGKKLEQGIAVLEEQATLMLNSALELNAGEAPDKELVTKLQETAASFKDRAEQLRGQLAALDESMRTLQEDLLEADWQQGPKKPGKKETVH